MKTTLTTLFFVLAASQANAAGFYQEVANNWQQADAPAEITESVTETTFTPLYLQVVGNSREELNHGKVVIRTPSSTTYTPLYQKVVGNPQQSKVHRIADEDSGKVNTGS